MSKFKMGAPALQLSTSPTAAKGWWRKVDRTQIRTLDIMEKTIRNFAASTQLQSTNQECPIHDFLGAETTKPVKVHVLVQINELIILQKFKNGGNTCVAGKVLCFRT